MRLKRSSILPVLAGLLILVSLFVGFVGVSAADSSQDNEAFEEPVTIVSLGRSPGAVMAKVLFKKADVEFSYAEHPEISAFKEDLPSTLVAVLGASNKGLGAAGINLKEEISWGEELFKVARENDIPVLVMHIEGEARRGDLSDKLIKNFVPKGDYVIIKKGANQDGIFTELCSENEIPLETKETGFAIVPTLEELFVDEG